MIQIISLLLNVSGRLLISLIIISVVFTGCGDSSEPEDDIDDSNLGEEEYVKTPFADEFNGNEVDGSVWRIATWVEHGGQTGRERCFVKDGYLNLVFINDSEKGFLSSAIETNDEFLYGRWEARLKASSIKGVLNSMYTIDWDNTADPSSSSDGTKQEIDIEFLTYSFSDSNGEVHLALHAEGKPSSGTNPDIALDFNPSDDFHIWGFDVTSEYIEWFVDDLVLKRITYSENAIEINAPYNLKFNFWSAEHWINGPPVPDTECIYLIDWVRFTPHPE